LAGALEARGIPTKDNLEADVEGRIESDGKFFCLAAVTVKYRLRIPRDKRKDADRALEIHSVYCPVHQSIKQGFQVSISADLQEE
jgi:uncharacterized OsmC-like protein